MCLFLQIGLVLNFQHHLSFYSSIYLSDQKCIQNPRADIYSYVCVQPLKRLFIVTRKKSQNRHRFNLIIIFWFSPIIIIGKNQKKSLDDNLFVPGGFFYHVIKLLWAHIRDKIQIKISILRRIFFYIIFKVKL